MWASASTGERAMNARFGCNASACIHPSRCVGGLQRYVYDGVLYTEKTCSTCKLVRYRSDRPSVAARAMYVWPLMCCALWSLFAERAQSCVSPASTLSLRTDSARGCLPCLAGPHGPNTAARATAVWRGLTTIARGSTRALAQRISATSYRFSAFT
jgi:hypothetical protein